MESMELLTLDIKGLVLAVILGFTLLFLGGASLGYFFVAAMLFFLALSAIVTYIGIRTKRKLKVGQEPRGFWNVAANGLPPTIMAVSLYAFLSAGMGRLSFIAAAAFIASVAGITSDKFSSELGVLNGMPRTIFGFRKARKGTSGAVSFAGTFAGLAGAAAIALLVPFIAGRLYSLYTYPASVFAVYAIVLVSGLFGSIVDSMFGYYEERGIGNKFTSNFLCGIAAAALCACLLAFL